MNDLTLASALATAPSSAFAELRDRPRFWFPLVLIVLTQALIVAWYYSVVDFEWLKEVMYGNNPAFQKMPEADRAAALGFITRTTLLWGSVIGTFIAFPLVFLVETVYLLIAAKVTKLPQGIKHWYSMACWTALPMVLNVIVAAILLALAENPQVGPGVMQPLSFNELVTHRAFGAPGQVFFESLTIPGILSWVLMIVGVRTWSQRSWVFSSIYVLLPIVLIYGIWSVFAFR